MFRDCQKYVLLLLLLFFEKSFCQSQHINYKELDTLLKYGKNYSALKAISSYDTLQLHKYDLGLLHLYKAKCFSSENKNAKAFLNFLKAKKEFYAVDSIEKAMSINLDIAFFLGTDKSNRKKAEKYLEDYLNYALKAGKNKAIANAYSSWGSLIMEERPMESKKLFKKALYYSEQVQDDLLFENLYSNIAVLYNEILQKPDSAIIYIDKSIAYGKKTKNTDGICINLINKAGCYYYKNDYEKALQLLHEANTLPISKNRKNIKSYIFEFLAVNYSALNDFKSGYESLNKAAKIKEEFNFEDQNTKISEFNIKYETKEKEIENLTLRAKMQRNRIITYTTLGLLVIAIIFTLLIYKNLSNKKKIAEQAQLIQTQRLEKTLKDRELHDIDVMLQSQEHERQQIANDLHDNLGSLLATVKINFENLSKSQKPEDKNLYDKTDALLEEAYQKVRNISHLKNLGVIGNQGLLVAVKKMAEKMTILNRLQMNVIPFGLTQRFANAIEVTLFRMIQELCTNIIKHSGANEVNIYMTQHNNDSINIMIEDNGKGFDVKKITNTNGIGLKKIEQKVEQMGGTFTIDSIPLKGTTIIIDLPL